MKILTLTAIVCLSSAAACASSVPRPQPPSSPPAPVSLSDQVAAGQKLYTDNCASCHGDRGQGG
jgi:mono/diheme cytochrome c family protein